MSLTNDVNYCATRSIVVILQKIFKTIVLGSYN